MRDRGLSGRKLERGDSRKNMHYTTIYYDFFVRTWWCLSTGGMRDPSPFTFSPTTMLLGDPTVTSRGVWCKLVINDLIEHRDLVFDMTK